MFRRYRQNSYNGRTIAIIANSTWNIYNFRLDLIKSLHQKGAAIIVIAPVDEYIHYLDGLKYIKHIPLRHLSPHQKNAWSDIRFLFELYTILTRNKPDLILNYTIKPNIFGSIASRLAGIPSIATLTGLGYTFLQKNWINKVVSQLYRLALKFPAQVVFHNRDDRQYFIDQKLVAPHKATVIAGSGVNVKYFRPLPQIKTNRFIFLFIGRLLSDKGLTETIAAMKSVKRWAKQAECWVVGELGSQNPMAIPKEKILEWQQEGIIRYFGRRKDIRSLIQAADVVLLPSYREGIPRAILEAMAMSKPIITTDTPGCRETVIHGKNGFLVPPYTIKPLAKEMLRLYQYEEADLMRLGSHSRKMACEYFSTDKINQEYLHLIRQIPQFETEDVSLEPSTDQEIRDYQYAEA